MDNFSFLKNAYPDIYDVCLAFENSPAEDKHHIIAIAKEVTSHLLHKYPFLAKSEPKLGDIVSLGVAGYADTDILLDIKYMIELNDSNSQDIDIAYIRDILQKICIWFMLVFDDTVQISPIVYPKQFKDVVSKYSSFRIKKKAEVINTANLYLEEHDYNNALAAIELCKVFDGGEKAQLQKSIEGKKSAYEETNGYDSLRNERMMREKKTEVSRKISISKCIAAASRALAANDFEKALSILEKKQYLNSPLISIKICEVYRACEEQKIQVVQEARKQKIELAIQVEREEKVKDILDHVDALIEDKKLTEAILVLEREKELAPDEFAPKLTQVKGLLKELENQVAKKNRLEALLAAVKEKEDSLCYAEAISLLENDVDLDLENIRTKINDLIVQQKSKLKSIFVEVDNNVKVGKFQQAVALLSSNKNIDPISVSEKLKEVNSKSINFLNDLYDKADRLTISGDYDSAISMLQKYSYLDSKTIEDKIDGINTVKTRKKLQEIFVETNRLRNINQYDSALALLAKYRYLNTEEVDKDIAKTLTNKLNFEKYNERQKQLAILEEYVNQQLARGNYREAITALRNSVDLDPIKIRKKIEYLEAEDARILTQQELSRLYHDVDIYEAAGNYEYAIQLLTQNRYKDPQSINLKISALTEKNNRKKLASVIKQADNYASGGEYDRAINLLMSVRALDYVLVDSKINALTRKKAELYASSVSPRTQVPPRPKEPTKPKEPPKQKKSFLGGLFSKIFGIK